MRLIDADKLISSFPKSDIIKDIVKTINYQETVNAIPITEGVTNGDMIKAIFYNWKPFYSEDCDCMGLELVDDEHQLFDISLDWWNKPYKIRE